MTFPFFLAFKDEGFGLWGGDEGVATGDDGWAGCLDVAAAAPEVTPDEDPTIFDRDERGNLGKGELSPLWNVSREVDSERSFDGLETQAFWRTPFGMGGGEGSVASIAIEEATGSAGGRE